MEISFFFPSHPMKALFLILISLCTTANSYAQIGISATNIPPNASAMLDVSSTTKGILIPRMTTIQKNSVPNKTDGLMVYDTDLKQFSYWIAGGTGTAIGYWQNFGTPTTPPTSVWNTNGNDINNTNTGNVVINNMGFSSSAKLDVQSNTATAVKITQVGPYEGLKIESGTSNNTNPVLNISNSTSAYGGYFRSSNATARGLYSLLDDANNTHDAIEGITFGNGNGGSFNSVSGTAGYFTSASGKALVTGNGNVGIGNASPTNKLSVTGNADFSGNVGIGMALPTNPLSVSGNANFMGNIGIGTTTPDQKLTIISNGIGISQQNTSGSVKIGFFASDNGAYLQTHTPSDLYFSTNNGNAAMVLKNANNYVGIGNNNPLNKVEIGIAPQFVGGDLAIGNGTQGMSFFQSPTSSTFYTNTNFSLLGVFGGSGRVGIGMNTPNSTLDVAGSQSMPFVFTSVDYAPSTQDYTIIANLQGDANKVININLPSPVLARGRIYQMRLIQSPGATTRNCIYDRERFGPVFNQSILPTDKGYVAIKDYNGDLITCLYEYAVQRCNNGIPVPIIGSILESVIGFVTGSPIVGCAYYNASRTSITIQSTGTRWIVVGENLVVDQYKW
jgi:hypothetical protein